MTAPPPLLGRRALNRATLARQGLLERWRLSPAAALERLVGLQAQAPAPPYYGLWSRLAGFRPEELGGMIEEGSAVRLALMRSTIHLVTADDALALRPLVQPALAGQTGGSYGRGLEGLDPGAVVAEGRRLLAEEALTSSELGRRLAERFPGREPEALANALRCWLPLAQVPPRGVWGRSGRAVHRPADAWLGRPFASEAADGALEALVLRYLGAFGPASVRDAQQWSGLRRLEPVFRSLRPRLATFRDEAGRELFDLPEAPRPDPDAPAPPRFLPEFDNLLLSHVDRERVLPAEHAPKVLRGGMVLGSVLLDGVVAASWRIEVRRRTARLAIELFRRPGRAERAGLEEEGESLLAFAAPQAAEQTIAWAGP